MFQNCTSLAEVTCLATDISAEYCTSDWLSGVATTGTFHKNVVMEDWPTNSASGIPTGWNVEEVSIECPISVAVNPIEGGVVSGAGDYYYGSSCTLTAMPNAGYTFINWTENGQPVSTNATYSFTVNQDRSLVANSIIVHGGTATNGYVPVYGYWAVAYLKSETVYPSEELNVLSGNTISGMRFFASQSDVSWGNANFKVFMKEVDEASISAFSGLEGATVVYEGPLSITGGTMDVVFSTPYSYNGGNLLIGVYNTVKGSYVTSTWYGENVSGASVQGYNSNSLDAVSPTQRNFIPKTMFFYEEGQSFTVTATASPSNGGTVSGGATYDFGETCTLTATANEGYFFLNWTEDGNQVSAETSYTFTVTGSRILVANFVASMPVPEPTDYSQEYFTITSWEPDNTITFHRGVSNLDLYISFDKINWSLFTSSSNENTTVVLGVGEKAYFKATTYQLGTSDTGNKNCYFSATKLFEASGNIMSLFKGDDFVGATTFYSSNDAYGYNLIGLFSNATTLLTLENLVIPVTQYNKWVFQSFASGCTSLIRAPKELPAQTYQGRNTLVWMFSGCTKLQESPVIRLTSNASSDGWHQMFNNCSSLKRVICLMQGTNLRVTGSAWLNGVPSGGVFYKNSSSTWQSGNTAIPASWTTRDWSEDPADFVKVTSTPVYRYSCYVEGTSDYYQAGDAVTLKCTPLNGYTFNGWYVGGTLVSTSDTYTFTADQDIEVTPVFDETMLILINGYGDSNGGYYLISTPYVSVNPANVAGMTDGDYDLYRFDQSEELEWRNYKYATFNLEAGKGYLYAHQTNAVLRFNGVPYSGTGTFALDYVEGEPMAGWNLVGNPYVQTLTAYATENVANGCYVMNETRDNLMVSEISETNPLRPYEGFFVKATDANASISFSPSRGAMAHHSGSIRVEVSEGGKLIDRLIVKTANGEPMEKLTLNENSTRIYATQGGEDYAIVTVGENAASDVSTNEIPVNFKAAKRGTCTITVDLENVEAEYLHLIDNLTGADIDLLETPTYTFEAKPSDYASRFKLVFEANEEDGVSTGSTTFAYYNGSEWVINNEGMATLQVIDALGRVLSSETINGNANVNINATPGLYVMRLVSGNDVKVQKIVVK